MADWQLTAESPFAGQSPVELAAGEVMLREVEVDALWSIAFDAKNKPDHFPAIAGSAPFERGVLLGMQADQVWLFGESATALAQEHMAISDQSDSWAMLRLEDQAAGVAVRTALERLCPLDLHPDAFPVGHVARTQMEHLAVVIYREAENRYLLMSPRSSAGSFLHAVQAVLETNFG